MKKYIRLSSPLSELPAFCPVVVVGSGYGGAIAASRLARAGQRVCVLERGREHPPGTFPDRLDTGKAEMQFDLPHGRVGPETGLYDFRTSGDIMTFMGCGLGGTSLVNANVAIRPDARLFADLRFPRALRDDADTELRDGYRRAEDMLAVTPYPSDAPKLPKLEALHDSAAHLGMPCRRPPLAVSFEPNERPSGIRQEACVGCGDCVSGCNYAAKNTLDRNYLPDAYAHGAQIFTEIMVRAVARDDAGWRIYFQPADAGREVFSGPELFIRAEVVILAAGTFGTTEILLRSRDRGLSLSERLGHGFSGNGDMVAFAYNADQEIRGIGLGDREPEPNKPVGPCITGFIDDRDGPLDQSVIVEDGSIPGLLGPLLPGLFDAVSLIDGWDSDRGIGDRLREWWRILESRVRGPYHGATRNTQTFLAMSHDDADGVLELDDDRVRVRWPDVGRKPVFRRMHALVARASEALGATYNRNPLWTEILGKKLITVHPLGGCGMGENAGTGVVDHKSRVFSGPSGTNVHPGLYVCDGAVLPRSIGVNPFLTISALAERAIAYLARDRDWTIDYQTGGHRTVVTTTRTPGIRFTERMKGHLIDHRTETRSPLSFLATITAEDLPAMLAHPDHGAALMGTVVAPALSSSPLTVVDGRFQLLYRDPQNPRARRMRYEMVLHSVERREFFLVGIKQIQGDYIVDAWADTTRLSYSVFKGGDQSGRVLGSGELVISAQDLLRQLSTMTIIGVADVRERRAHLLRFLEFFGRSLAEVYLKNESPETRQTTRSKTRQQPGDKGSPRPSLRAAIADVKAKTMRTVERNIQRHIPLYTLSGVRDASISTHTFSTEDGLGLSMQRFTRNPGDDAVLIIHGLTTSSDMFIMPEHDNLVSYLLDHGYGDVWCLDFRMSNRHPYNLWRHRFTMDDIALYDYPPAVELIRQVSGARRIHVIAHCLGAISFAMSLFGGVTKGIHSAIFNSASLRVKVPRWSHMKLRTGPFLVERVMGQPYISPRWADEPWWTRRGLVARATSLFHRENSIGSCHMLSLMWGTGFPAVYVQENLMPVTHRRSADLYGGTGMHYYRHVRKMVESDRRAVKYAASDPRYAALPDDYVANAHAIEVPCLFMTGSENRIFVDSNVMTFKTLKARVPGLHELQVFQGYGHQDVFMGKHVARDVFPRLIQFLDKKRENVRSATTTAVARPNLRELIRPAS
ncbi:MAG: alpha/beta fold hydrolase [Proteobacteria bacterium]|nr:alpha/beta fold hydrolase [Pseudomonadota bacterium]